MTSEKVFVAIGIYQAIRVSITVFMPFAIQTIAEMQVCCGRLQVSVVSWACCEMWMAVSLQQPVFPNIRHFV